MKTAIYIEGQISQIVLTPENDFEIEIIERLEKSNIEATTVFGSFYGCQGGYFRKSETMKHGEFGGTNADNSIILRFSPKA